MRTTRRRFLEGSAAVAGVVATRGALAAPPGRARIVMAEDPKVHRTPVTVDEARVEALVDRALAAYAGTASAAEALGRFFRPEQKIAIKINTLGSPYSSVNPEVAFHLAALLQKMGTPPDRIRIFDQYQTRMRKGRYRLRRRPGTVWVTKHIGRDRRRYTYVDPTDPDYKVAYHYDKLIVWADAVLNVCVPKDHDLTGITGALKNMAMGVMQPTPERAANKANPGHYTVVPRFHRNHCDPAIAWLYRQPMIRDKVKLIVVDALRVLYHGGPQDRPRWRVPWNQIWVTEDPVACDATILRLVNRLRRDHGMVPVEQDRFRGKLRLPVHIQTAARYGLGVADPDHIDIERVTL